MIASDCSNRSMAGCFGVRGLGDAGSDLLTEEGDLCGEVELGEFDRVGDCCR